MAIGSSLVATLGLNSTTFATGLTKASKKTKTFASKFKTSMGGLQTAFLGVTAVLGTKKLLDNADALRKSADAAGFGFEEYQRLQHGFEEAGISQEAFQKSTVKLSKAFNDAGRGTKTAIDAFADLGLSYDALEQLSPEERFIAVNDALSKVDDASKKQAIALELLGKKYAGVTIDIDSVVAAGEDLVVITEEAADGAVDSNDAFLLMGKNLKNLSTNILGPLVKSLVPVVDGFTDFAKEHPNITKLGLAITAVATAVKLLGGPLSIIVGGIGLAITAWQNWDEIVGFFKTKWDQFSDKFPGAADAIKTAIDVMLTPLRLLKKAFGAVFTVFEDFSLTEILGNIVEGVRAKLKTLLLSVQDIIAKIPLVGEAAAKKFHDNIIYWFEETKTKALDESPIPELVDGVRAYVDQLPKIADDAGKGFHHNIITGFKGAMEEAEKTTEQYKDVGTKVFDGLTQSLINFTKTGKFNFKQFAISIIQDIIAIEIRAQTSALLKSLLPSLSIGTGTGTSVPARASGGPVSAGKPYLVGENGPELFTPGSNGNITANGAGGNMTTVNVNVSGNLDDRAINQIRNVIASSSDLVGQGAQFFQQSTRGLALRQG